MLQTNSRRYNKETKNEELREKWNSQLSSASAFHQPAGIMWYGWMELCLCYVCLDTLVPAQFSSNS